MSNGFDGFPKSTLKFLRELKKNNERPWFNANKSRYESDVLEPSLALIEAIGPGLKKVSPHFLAVPKRVGGSLMRVYRDTRFSKDKTPYKTNIGIHFRHEFGKDVHAPGFYLHIEPKESFFGAGIWHPENAALKKIRDQIVEDPNRYRRISRTKKLLDQYEFAGDSLKRPPRGFDSEHPLIEELKRKDYILVGKIDNSCLGEAAVVNELLARMRTTFPLIRFLCDALKLPS